MPEDHKPPPYVTHGEFSQFKEFVASAFRSQDSAIHDIGSEIKALRREVSERQKTNWGTLGTWMGVVVVMGGLALAPLYRDLNDVETDLHEHESIVGHVGMVERVKSLEREIFGGIQDGH